MNLKLIWEVKKWILKIKEKLIIDNFKKQMIYFKYKDQIKIDMEKIANEISQKTKHIIFQR